jgi:glutathione S-transferase
MKIHLFPPSGRVIANVALKHHLELEWEVVNVDLGRGDNRTLAYKALNSNQKVPTLQDGDLVLWESNAILMYLASKRPDSGMWPLQPHMQADVLRWMFWESAHWDAESIGMVAYEKRSRTVLGQGTADPAFIARGEQNFDRFAPVLEQALERKKWLVGGQVTIADFSVAGLVPSAEALGLPLAKLPNVQRWYGDVASLPAWRQAMAARQASIGAFFTGKSDR